MRSARAHGDHSVQQDVEKQDGVPGPSVHPRATHTAQACHPDLHALFWGGRKGNLAQKQFASLLPLEGLTSVTAVPRVHSCSPRAAQTMAAAAMVAVKHHEQEPHHVVETEADMPAESDSLLRAELGRQVVGPLGMAWQVRMSRRIDEVSNDCASHAEGHL